MSSSITTRSSQARPKRNIKAPRRLISDCDDFRTKHQRNVLGKNSDENKLKTPVSSKNKNRRGKSKKKEGDAQLLKDAYVVLTRLSENVGRRKVQTVEEGTGTKSGDVKRNHRRSPRQRNNFTELGSVTASDTTIKHSPGENQSINVGGIKGKRGHLKINRKMKQENKFLENKNDNIKTTSNISEKQPRKENAANKQELFKKPTINRMMQMSSNKPTPVPLKLRNRQFVNYAESSLDSSTDSQENPGNVEKVPIYKLPVVEEKKKKRPIDDLYEFDESDGENAKNKKQKKDTNSSCEEYDRTIRNILKNVVNKVRKRNKKKVIYSDAKNNNAVKSKQIKFVKRANVEDKPQEEKEKTGNKTMRFQQNRISQEEKSELPDDTDCDDSCFGFNNVPARPNASKIKIISNIQLQPEKELNLSVASPARFRENRPKANSTMLNNVFSPWRFNEINIKRNPHFLAIKESSLPCITQEMVLDHSIVEKFEDLSKSHVAKTPQQTTLVSPSKKKTPVQKHLTDYFGDKSENKENPLNISLFDDNQFSPIKTLHTSDRVNSVRRKILCERDDDNIIQASTPVRNRNQPDDDHTNFGFTTDEEENEEPPKETKGAKPFRVSVNVNDKKYTKKKAKFSQSGFPLPQSDDEDSEEVSDTESHHAEYKLFDDLNDTEDYFKELRPVAKKRTKFKWMTEDSEKPRKKKDVRTKEEEEEAEKWAAAFNSMCEEIEEFPLEIE